ncbi:MAG: lamin tail domain-containing protein [Bacteroidales bacterium]|nr:lamin tail domain-containing protein [Bacteroidales bacterium]
MKKIFFAIPVLALAIAGCVKDEPYVNPNPTPEPEPEPTPTVEQTLFINEVNCGTKQFEIYNAADKAADIAGYVFKKDDSGDWEVPAGKGKIPAKGFLVFTAKNPDIAEGPGFGLSGTKGFKLTMLKDGEIVDEIDNSATVDGFKTVDDGWSLSRKTDGGSEWVLVEGGTMGASNGSAPAVEGKIVFNELDCGNKKIEIYNGTSKEVDLEGYTLCKDADEWVIPAGRAKVPAKGFVVFTGKSADASVDPTFGLSGTKGFLLKIKDKDGNVIEEVNNTSDRDGGIVAIEDGKSWGRKTDGSDEWVIFSVPSIGESNSKGTI